jgi:N-acetyl sugar amidotransferase
MKRINPSARQICSKGIWDTTVPGITFDQDGVSNYAKLHDKLTQIYPRGEEGIRLWESLIDRIKKKGHNKRYDCIVGVSGGTDSCYLLYLANQAGLRPLAVNLDNGWSSDIAVKNIKKVTNALNIDLETYVIDYEEVQAVLRSYMKARLPWIDSPTDIAIKAALYKTASREGIKFILNGADFRTEGKQPTRWTYSDAKQMLFLIRKYERIRLKSFPYYTLLTLFYYGFIKKIKMFRPYYFLDYKKKEAQQFLKEQYGWEYYGEHHHENLFTKFTIAYWLPRKFGIDKRIITYSAQVMSGEITRDSALSLIGRSPYDPLQMERDKVLVLKKLDLQKSEFDSIWNSPNTYYSDYPSYMPLLKKINRFSQFAYKMVFPFKPTLLTEQEIIE